MDKSIIVDVAAFSGLFLFTGAEVAIESTIFEIISKFGVVAVLWFWLKEMKEQMKVQSKDFYQETEKLRQEHKSTMHEFQEIHKEHKDLLTEQLKAKDEIIRSLKK
jgi:predicted secreted protein